jgi:hypothetical protein
VSQRLTNTANPKWNGFNDEDALLRVAQAIIVGGTHTGFARGYDRYGLMFAEAIGVRIAPDGSTLPYKNGVKIV